MNKSLKFVLIIFFVIILPLIVLAFFYSDVYADEMPCITEIESGAE
jgi:hypothetical protein